MKIIQHMCGLVGLALLTLSQAFASPPAGFVKSVSGDASIVSGGKTVAAQPGSPVALGDVVRTGANGSLGLTLRDNTLLSFGPSTTFTLEDFLFSPAQGDLRLSGAIAAGSMLYVSGAIAKLKPEAVQLKTPTGVIGVRGTRFAVVVPQ